MGSSNLSIGVRAANGIGVRAANETTFAWIGARLVVRRTYATRRQLPAWVSGAHCSWKVETDPSCHCRCPAGFIVVTSTCLTMRTDLSKNPIASPQLAQVFCSAMTGTLARAPDVLSQRFEQVWTEVSDPAATLLGADAPLPNAQRARLGRVARRRRVPSRHASMSSGRTPR